MFRADIGREELRRVYGDGGYEEIRGEHYLRELAARRRDARVRLDYMAPWAREGRLLDIGAAGGAFVAEASARGFQASGIEPVPSFAQAAREQLGLDVRVGSVEDVDLGGVQFDAITMWHVLEHVADPLTHLSRLADALDIGGVIAVEVPNFDSAVARHMGARWPSLEPAVHVNQFGPGTLRELIERAGLTLLELTTTPITPYLTLPARLGPGHLAARLKAAIWLRDPRERHPTGHELLRAVARRDGNDR